MLTLETLHWRGEIVLTRDLVTAGDRTEFYSRVNRGEYTSLFRGAFARSKVWDAATKDERYLLLLTAGALMDSEIVLSHLSAAAVWRLPIVGSWPERIHTIEGRVGLRHSTSVFRRHLEAAPENLVEIGGLRATDLARTVVDVAASSAFGPAVAIADAALRRTTHPIAGMLLTRLQPSDLLAELARVDLRHGTARAARVIGFADASADRPGESMSRVAMAVAHITVPCLQVVLYGRSGRRYVVDFYWPEFGMIGEFDGEAKYSDPEFLRGRTPEQALRDEKFREDDLRAAGHGMTRWGWRLAMSPSRLRSHLIAAGIR